MRVTEKKEDLGAEVRITGASKGGPFTWVRDSHSSPPSGSWLSIILFTLYLASASPTLKLDLPPAPGITFLSPRAALSLSLHIRRLLLFVQSRSSQPFRPYVLLSSTSPWPTFIPISLQPLHINLSRLPITTVLKTHNLNSNTTSPPQPSYTLLASSLPPIPPRMIPRITIRHQNQILLPTLHGSNTSTISRVSRHLSSHSQTATT